MALSWFQDLRMGYFPAWLPCMMGSAPYRLLALRTWVLLYGYTIVNRNETKKKNAPPVGLSRLGYEYKVVTSWTKAINGL